MTPPTSKQCNRPCRRAAQFAPYDLEEWVTDVVRSWAKIRPREAFTWMFAVRSRFEFEPPRRSCFERVVTDWARVSPQAGRDAEAEALAIRDDRLRQEAIIGVVRGSILRGDASRVGPLVAHITIMQLWLRSSKTTISASGTPARNASIPWSSATSLNSRTQRGGKETVCCCSLRSHRAHVTD